MAKMKKISLSKSGAAEKPILPFANYSEWLLWKRQQQADYNEYDELFSDPERNPFGLDDFHTLEAYNIASDIPGTLGPIEGVSGDRYDKLAKELGCAIAAVQWGKTIDLERLGVRIDPCKMLLSDAISILMQELVANSSRKDFYTEWVKIREVILTEGTQVAKTGKVKSAEDPVMNLYCRWTFWALKRGSTLSDTEIRRVQKILYTQFLMGQNFRHPFSICKLVENDRRAIEFWPRYAEGVLAEKPVPHIQTPKEYNPGNLDAAKGNPGEHHCRHRRSSGRRGASHCMNGNLCRYIDDKIDAWYRSADPRLLQYPRSI